MPGTPGSPGASRPGAGTAGAAGGGATTVRRSRGGRAARFEDWDFWWGHNKEIYLNLKDRLYDDAPVSDTAAFFFGRRRNTGTPARSANRPTEAFVRARLVPRLLTALGSDSFDLRDSALLALGKAGGPEEVAAMLAMVKDKVRSVRENAVMSLGVLGAKEAIPPLLALLDGRRAGQKLRGRKPESRLRAFAATSLGMIGDNAHNEVRAKLADLAGKAGVNRNVAVNCAIGLGLLVGDTLYVNRTAEVLRSLVANPEKVDRWVRVHAVVALARLHRHNGLPPSRETITFLTRLAKRDRVAHVRRSAVIGLGLLVQDPNAEPDAVKFLCQQFLRARDNATRHFAAIALGQVGGEIALKRLREGVLTAKDQRRAFAALGLAILCERWVGDPQCRENRDSALKTLRTAFEKEKAPHIRGGLAIALGIARDATAGPMLLSAMSAGRDPAYRGYVALALGMVRYAPAVAPMLTLMQASDNQPLLKQQTAIGLGLLGSRDVIGPLVDVLKEGKTSFMLCSATQALGFVGDRTAVKPLIEVMDGEKNTALARGYAAIALGNIVDPRPIPAVALIAANHNYLANTACLAEMFYVL